MTSTPLLKDVVLVGAGHAHVEVLRTLGLRPIPDVRLTLISREVDTPYSGMLPGLIAGHYTFRDAHIDTRPLAQFAGARLVQGEVIGLDTRRQLLMCRGLEPQPYDVVSFDIGSTPSARDIPGATEHAIPVKPIDGFLPRFDAALGRVLAMRGRARIGVVGGGAGGVELLLAMHHRLTREVMAAGHDPAALSFTVLTSSDSILPAFPVAVRRRLTRHMASRDIVIRTGSRVVAVTASGVDLVGGEHVPLDAVFWTTRAAAAPWLASTGLALDADGFIRVRPTLQVIGNDTVFAVGDVATIDGSTAPKSGVYAVRAGRPLADNIRRLVAGERLALHVPQSDALYLISTGDTYAVGTRNGVTVEGRWVWRVKDWIDRRFMARFQTLPSRPTAGADAI